MRTTRTLWPISSISGKNEIRQIHSLSRCIRVGLVQSNSAKAGLGAERPGHSLCTGNRVDCPVLPLKMDKG